jgi:hypothetical protein
MELGYTLLELQSSIKVNRPIDSQKHEGLKLKYSMDLDEQVYKGDAELGILGMLNSTNVTNTNAANGAASSPLWSQKVPAEILADVNVALAASWAATGYAFVPTKMILPPLNLSYIVQQVVSTAGNVSIIEYLKKNSLSTAQNGKDLEIVPVKWATGAGAGSTNRLAVYTQDLQRVRIPLTPLLNTPIQYKGIHYLTYYYGRIGSVEFTNPQFFYYLDGI